MYLGIDDTDSRTGMCTTYVGFRIILKLIEMGYDIIGYPRLVRLNPNVPWKTRGNGSVVIRFGKGSGGDVVIGEIDGRSITAKKRLVGDVDVNIDDLIKDVERYFVLDEKNTNPGVVLTPRKLPQWLYWRGVRELLTVDEIERVLKANEAQYKKYKNGRGIIGASCGISWRPKFRTYELLTYLPEDSFYKHRFVDPDTVKRLDAMFPSTFDNYDYENDYTAIMPNSTTPVLYGIRGTSPEELLLAKDVVKSTDYEGFLIYETNQGSDDHLVRRRIKDIKPFTSVIVRGTVSKRPRRIQGGHTIFSLEDLTGTVECAAYEPTKKFRDIVSSLEVGDVVEVYGGVRNKPITVNIEKIRILRSVPVRKKVSNPLCPVCGRKMESIGRGKGYRCRRCGTRAGEEDAVFVEVRRNMEGFYEVPVIARRHLSKPLKLMKS